MAKLANNHSSLMKKIQSRGVSSRRLLYVMQHIDRRKFLNNSFAVHAYEDMPLPITCGQTTSQPSLIGLMIQKLEIDEKHRVLEIGTGSGYQTTILSHLCRHVYSLDRFQSISNVAKKIVIDKHMRQNVSIIYSDGANGLPDAAPFDRIIVSAASENIPPILLKQLKRNGIMVLPVGRQSSEQCLMKVVKNSNGDVECTDLGAVRFVPLLEGVDDE